MIMVLSPSMTGCTYCIDPPGAARPLVYSYQLWTPSWSNSPRQNCSGYPIRSSDHIRSDEVQVHHLRADVIVQPDVVVGRMTEFSHVFDDIIFNTSGARLWETVERMQVVVS